MDFAVIAQTLGGLGLFLLGLIVMTDGLRSLAGDTIRVALLRYTHCPLSGAMTGALGTALVQSSSATTVAAVGFVEAGLMHFSEALGIIFGANLGTTVTGWLVLLFGFKLKLGLLALPLVFIGAVMRLFGRGKYAGVGFAIAGFGLLFVGISMLQEGLEVYRGTLWFEQFPADTWAGRLQLVAMGMIFTVITQSSSAGVAMTLSALFAGLINFEQAAALVIGMDIGTTVKVAIVSIGGSSEVRRTGFSHITYNFFTGIGALLLITPYAMFWEYFSPGNLLDNAEVALVGFHTLFNGLGVLIVLPFARAFSRMMYRLVPSETPQYTSDLDSALLNKPSVALTAAQNSVQTEFLALLRHLKALYRMRGGARADLRSLQLELDRTHDYVDMIHLHAGDGAMWERLLAILQILDHLQRLHERCDEEEDRAVNAAKLPELEVLVNDLKSTIYMIMQMLEEKQWNKAAEAANTLSRKIHKNVKPYRHQVAEAMARGEVDVVAGTERLEAIRWLRRVSRHMAHIASHLSDAVLAAGK